MTCIHTESPPEQVTDADWDELQAQGFRWLTNAGWPFSGYEYIRGEPGSTERAYVAQLYRKHGSENVKIGWPKNEQGRPDRTFHPESRLVGIYARTTG
jgi:hypothetical protein